MADADLPTDDEVLTQFVHAGEPPNCSPRPQDRDGLSLIRGRLDVTEAGHLVKFRSGAEA